MGPSTFILGVFALWAGVLLLIVAHALVTGRIRLGGPGSAPIWRDEAPVRFWTTLALSTGGLVGLGLLLRLFFRATLPVAWAQAMGILGLG